MTVIVVAVTAHRTVWQQSHGVSVVMLSVSLVEMVSEVLVVSLTRAMEGMG